MRAKQNFSSPFVLAPLLAVLSGCADSLIQLEPGSDRVTLAEANRVSDCQHIGKTTVNVVSRVGIYSRTITDVDVNLLQLARNGAIEEGGDTVVAGERQDIGKRTFLIYKCHHDRSPP